MKNKILRLAIVGGGVMGEAIVKAIINQRLLSAQDIFICDLDTKKLQKLQKSLGVKTSTNFSTVAGKVGIVILAIKPQHFSDWRIQEKRHLTNKHLLVSIMAGVGVSALKKAGTTKVVRAMPNTPAQIGQGMTVWTADKSITANQKTLVKNIFKSFGQELEIKFSSRADDIIDSATALSGSGPAYVFYFLEQLINAGQKLGFTKEQANKLSLQTFRGAIELLTKSADDVAVLRQKVTSKGGTTQAALGVLAKTKTDKNIIKAVLAAKKRAKQLRTQVK